MSGYRSGVFPGPLVTKADTAGQTALPTTLTYTTATTSASPTTFGAWVQVVASTAAEYLIVGVAARTALSLGGPIFVDVGEGGAGSESSIGMTVIDGITPLASAATLAPGGDARFGIPMRVSASTRLAVRAALGDPNGSTRSVTIQLLVVPYTNVAGN